MKQAFKLVERKAAGSLLPGKMQSRVVGVRVDGIKKEVVLLTQLP